MKRIHYAWLVCLSCTLLLTCTLGLCQNIVSVYLPYLEADGMSGTQGGALISIRCLAGIFAMMMTEPYYALLSLRRGLAFACGTAALASLMQAVACAARLLWLHNVAALVSGLAYGMGCMIPVGILVRRWFTQRQGTALGVCASGSGIGTVLFPPLVNWMIETFGLPVTFCLQGIFIFVVAILVYLVIRDDPTQMGLTSYGSSLDNKSEKQDTSARKPWNLGRSGHRMLLLCCMLTGAMAIASTSHFSVFLVGQGVPLNMTPLTISIFGLSLTVSKLVCGTQYDQLGGKRASLRFLAAAVGGYLICCVANASHPFFAFLGMALLGVGLSPATVGLPIWAADFSESASYPNALKWCQTAYAIGGMVFSLLTGQIFDWTGSYLPAYYVYTGVSVIIMVCLMLAYKEKTRLCARQAE